MRFSLGLFDGGWVHGGGSQETLELAQRADEGGFDSLFVTEDPDGWDAFALLAAISQRTTRILLGTAVTNPYLRNPNLIAASTTTLDRLAPGRVILGLGRGQPEWYERSLGMQIGSPLGRLEETISLLHEWWSEGTASIDGEFHIDQWERIIRPELPIPIFIAAAGPKALTFAGRVADGVIFNMLATPEYLAGAVERVRSAAEEAGRDVGALAFVANPGISVTDDPAKVLSGRKRFVATVLTLPGMEVLLQNPEVDVASIMASVRTIMKTDEILSRGGAFTDFAREGDIDAAVAVIPDALVERGSIVGTLEHVRQRIDEFASVGITDLMVDQRSLPADAPGVQSFLDSLQT